MSTQGANAIQTGAGSDDALHERVSPLFLNVFSSIVAMLSQQFLALWREKNMKAGAYAMIQNIEALSEPRLFSSLRRQLPWYQCIIPEQHGF